MNFSTGDAQNSHEEATLKTSSQTTQAQPWTDEAVARFWEYENAKQKHDSFYFSYHYATAILLIARQFRLLGGDILDYGSARGFFLKQLLQEPHGSVQALEFSRSAVSELDHQFSQHQAWRPGLTLEQWNQAQPEDQYDLIFAIELIEHLVGSHFEATFEGFYRAIRPGGHLFLTTPCREDLSGQFLLCPGCSTEFHPVQHVRSFTPDQLRDFLRDQGWEVVFCESYDLNRLVFGQTPLSWKYWSCSTTKRKLEFHTKTLLDRLFPRQPARVVEWGQESEGRHLIAIARKPLA